MLHLLPPGVACCFIAFGRPQRLFFCVHPPRLIARLMVDGLTLIPSCCSQAWQYCSNVASGASESNWSTFCCKGANFWEGLPGMGFEARVPVSRHCLRYRLMVETEMANTFAAPITRSLRSVEYAFILPAYSPLNTSAHRSRLQKATFHELSEAWFWTRYITFYG